MGARGGPIRVHGVVRVACRHVGTFGSIGSELCGSMSWNRLATCGVELDPLLTEANGLVTPGKGMDSNSIIFSMRF